MAEKPILFSTPMVQAILDGRKTQTRRVIKPNIIEKGTNWFWNPNENVNLAPYKPGDILWVRETWNYSPNWHYCYKADTIPDDNHGYIGSIPWLPSIFMPREAARIFLRVKNVRVERLSEITEEDAIAEGMSKTLVDGVVFISAKGNFHVFWDSLNIKRGYGWDSNPWVWVISFERIEL